MDTRTQNDPRTAETDRKRPRRARSVGRLLSTVDWDFASCPANTGLHNLHPYPARFIPQIPRELIRLFPPRPGEAVLDPFCGSGTTLVEARSAGFSAIGVDLNPVATLIAKVKTTGLSEPLGPIASEIVASGIEAPIPVIPRLDHWFTMPVQRALARITAGIREVHNEAIRDALRVALSRIVVRVSNQESDTRYAAIANDVPEADVYEQFVSSAEYVHDQVNQASPSRGSDIDCQLLTKDVLDVDSAEIGQPVGLVVTSPPYPNAYEYWLYHKYRMYWLGLDPISVRTREIGARPHYFKKNHQTEHDFEDQMRSVFGLISAVLTDDGVACFVVGRSVIHGREIDNASLLTRAAQASGLQRLGSATRNIARSRRSFNLSHASISVETIALFGR